MSFVVVLPAEPTTATTCAPDFDRTSAASVASATSWSSGTSVAAPRERASLDVANARVERDEQLAGADLARVRPHRGDDARRPPSSRPSSSAAISSQRERDHDAPSKRLARDLAVVERGDDAADVLPLLVPLPGDHDDVPVAGQRHRAGDRAAPIGVDLDVEPGALEDVLDDRERLLRARVVGGDDRDVRELGCDLAHQRPLPAIAVAAGAEDDDHPPCAEVARGARAPCASESGVCA